MKKTLQLKGVAVIAMIGLTVLTQSLKTQLGSESANIVNEYSRFAKINLTKEMVPAPTSDVVPLPFCRNKFIDLSSNPNYPIPHWIFSLPKSSDKALVLAIAKNESRFKPYAVSHKGAVGLMQLMPETASYVMRNSDGKDFTLVSDDENLQMHRPRSAFDFQDPYISLAVGSRYLEHLQAQPYIGDEIIYTLTAYNAGPGMFKKWKNQYRGFSPTTFAAHIPFKETRNYVRKVMNDYRRYQQLIPPIKEITWVKAEGC